MIDAHSLKVLEYDAVLEIIANFTSSECGKWWITGRTPQFKHDKIIEHHNLFKDMMVMLCEDWELPVLHFKDSRDFLKKVSPFGAVLNGIDIWELVGQLRLVTRLKRFVVEFDDNNMVLCFQGKVAALSNCDGLLELLERSIDNEGAVLDGASSELRNLRRELRKKEVTIKAKLDGYLRSSQLDGVFQEKFVTQRNGRYVLPIRAEGKSKLKGVVHDHSNSGRTLFVEPMATLEIGNELASLHLQERDECLRVLGELCDKIRISLNDLWENFKILTLLDASQAVGRWALSYDCYLPKFADALRLVSARHPLLEHQFRVDGEGKKVVPLNLWLNDDTAVMAITGSNTGGKSVILKSIGLLTVLAQAGFPVPAAPGSSFICFSEVLADIGDEQSIEANLSTFSAHLQNVKKILRVVRTRRSLVLLDELGAGTDPIEGGALACAVLQELTKGDALTFATTHLGVVKKFVHENERMLNAAVRFNMDSLQPEYRLDIGRPGASHALSIAKKLGLDDEVLRSAQEFLSSDHLHLEGMLAEMEEDQRKITSEEQRISTLREEIDRDKNMMNSELQKLRKERKKLLHEAYQQAESIVGNTRSQMERLIAGIKDKSVRDEAKVVACELRKKVDAKKKKLQQGLKQTAAKPDKPLQKNELKVGKRVWVEKLQAHGKIKNISDDKKKVTVEVSGLSFNMKAKELGRGSVETEVPKCESVRVTRPRLNGAVKHEINLIGKQGDEMDLLVNKFLDQGILGGLSEVRIVHGYGTGRLRKAIHEVLKEHPYVTSFRLGDSEKDCCDAGVTIISLD